jgi:hypothetical protein
MAALPSPLAQLAFQKSALLELVPLSVPASLAA